MANTRKQSLRQRTIIHLHQPNNRRTTTTHTKPLRRNKQTQQEHRQTIRQNHKTNNTTKTINRNTHRRNQHTTRNNTNTTGETMNNKTKELHLKAIHKLCYQATKHIIINNNNIETLKKGYEIKYNDDGKIRKYQITLEIKEINSDEEIIPDTISLS